MKHGKMKKTRKKKHGEVKMAERLKRKANKKE